jgi:hypothetical protein
MMRQIAGSFAMAAGVVQSAWDVEDMVLVLEKYERENSN